MNLSREVVACFHAIIYAISAMMTTDTTQRNSTEWALCVMNQKLYHAGLPRVDFNAQWTEHVMLVVPYDAVDGWRCDDVRHGASSAVLTSMTSVAFDVGDVASWRWSVSETHDVRLSCYERRRFTSQVYGKLNCYVIHLP